jgi:glycolate oxidase
MGDLAAQLTDVVGRSNLLTGDDISDDYGHDEALNVVPQRPAYVAKPATAEEVAALLTIAAEHRLPVTARGSGCGLSAAARPVEGGLLISFERMNAVLEVDADNHVAVVQPG